MKLTTIVLVVACLVAGSFLGAAGTLLVSHERALGSRFAYVDILNESPQTVSQVELTYLNGVVRHGPLAVGEQVLLPLPCQSEASYSVTVDFADGRTLSNRERYVEAGTRTQERVDDTEIVTQPLGAY